MSTPDQRILDELTVLAMQLADGEAMLNDLIEEARQEGHSLRAIAKATGTAPQTILNIINRRTDQ